MLSTVVSFSSSYCFSPGFGVFFTPERGDDLFEGAFELGGGHVTEILGDFFAFAVFEGLVERRGGVGGDPLDDGDRSGGDARLADPHGDRETDEEGDEKDAEERAGQSA